MKHYFDIGDYVRYYSTDGTFDGKVIAMKGNGGSLDIYYNIKWQDGEPSKWLHPRCLKKLIEPNDIFKTLL